MNQNRFWELLSKKQACEATPEEQTELNEYILHNNINMQSLAAIKAYWELPVTHNNTPSEEQVHSKWEKIKKEILLEEEAGQVVEMKPSNHSSFYKFSIAASIITILSFSIYCWWGKKTPVGKPQENIVSTKNGSKSKVQLPDGTSVWLNAGSKILYDEHFNDDERNVQLMGEAYFDVVHNPNKPFIIHTKSMNVKVLGTVFNIRAYPTDQFTEASLIKGSIQVSFPGKNKKIIVLKPNEKITILNKSYKVDGSNMHETDDSNTDSPDQTDVQPEATVSALTYHSTDNSVVETAWVLQNKLVFRSKYFQDLSLDMERWFDVDMQFADEAIMGVKFTGTFSTETVIEALGALQLSYHFKYKYDKNLNLITIYTK
jgi:transmembrane sensor